MQYGVPLRVLVNKFSHTRFEPMGHTSNPDIRIAKSLVDYIFRWLDLTFQSTNGDGRYPVANAKADAAPTDNGKAKPATNGQAVARHSANGHAKPSSNGASTVAMAETLAEPAAKAVEEAQAALKLGGEEGGQGEQFASFQSDAPSCDNCGSITVRNGNCYLCHNCGNSMGCS